MEYARREILGVPYHGQDNRAFHAGHATSWLKYATLEFRPTVPEALDIFLADAHNRDDLLAAYVAQPENWVTAIRLELPVFGSEGFLLNAGQSEWFLAEQEHLLTRLGDCDREDALPQLMSWRARLETVPVPLRLVDNAAQFLRPETQDNHVLRLEMQNMDDGGTT